MVSAEMLCLLAEQMLNRGVRRGGERKDRGLMWKDVAGGKWEEKTRGHTAGVAVLTETLYQLYYTAFLTKYQSGWFYLQQR